MLLRRDGRRAASVELGILLGVRPFEHDSRGRRHHDVHVYAELAGTRTQEGRDISNNNALSLGFATAIRPKHHTLFEIGASAPIGLSHDARITAGSSSFNTRFRRPDARH